MARSIIESSERIARERLSLMPIEVRIDVVSDFGVVEIHGEVAGEELAQKAIGLLQHPDYHPKMNMLWDLRDGEYVGSLDPLRALANFVAEPGAIEEPSRVAILVDRDHDFGIARLFESHAEAAPVSYSVFRSEAKAYAWLGIDLAGLSRA